MTGDFRSQVAPGRAMLEHAGCEGQPPPLTNGQQPLVEAPDDGVEAAGYERSHVQGGAERAWLGEEVEGAWRAFGHAATLPSRVSPSLPILFFGNLHAYYSSRMRILTVGLNPSLHEFPVDSPFRRFPLARGVTVSEPGCYLEALSAYFRTDPYRGWFSTFEPLLNGVEASYYEGQPSTVLHTDICSPVATDPTWSGLDPAVRKALEKDGGPLWHSLLKALRPQIVILSVARRHLSRIRFKVLSGWRVVHVFERTQAGAPRKQPVMVSARWCEISGEPSLLVFVPAAQKPLGRLGSVQKREAGVVSLEVLRRGR